MQDIFGRAVKKSLSLNEVTTTVAIIAVRDMSGGGVTLVSASIGMGPSHNSLLSAWPDSSSRHQSSFPRMFTASVQKLSSMIHDAKGYANDLLRLSSVSSTITGRRLQVASDVEVEFTVAYDAKVSRAGDAPSNDLSDHVADTLYPPRLSSIIAELSLTEGCAELSSATVSMAELNTVGMIFLATSAPTSAPVKKIAMQPIIIAGKELMADSLLTLPRVSFLVIVLLIGVNHWSACRFR